MTPPKAQPAEPKSTVKQIRLPPGWDAALEKLAHRLGKPPAWCVKEGLRLLIGQELGIHLHHRGPGNPAITPVVESPPPVKKKQRAKAKQRTGGGG